MTPRSRIAQRSGPHHGRLAASRRTAIALAASGLIVILFVVRGLQVEEPNAARTSLSAEPSPALSSVLTPDAVDFETALVRMIQKRRRLTATIHVALFDQHRAGSRRTFADGDNPSTNLYWGALFGLETHFANAAGWRRAYTDDGDGAGILRRVVFHRIAEPTPDWRARGVTERFDVYVLANAWPSSRIVDAMEQPLQEALCGRSVLLNVDGRAVAFGGDSAIVGYVGQNHMIDEYWDPFDRLGHCRPERQVGIFYLCPRSAVVLHHPIVERGLYSVLFTRAAATPEAYLVDGMFGALFSGKLGDGFISEAATQYAKYQKSVSYNQAASMLIR